MPNVTLSGVVKARTLGSADGVPEREVEVVAPQAGEAGQEVAVTGRGGEPGRHVRHEASRVAEDEPHVGAPVERAGAGEVHRRTRGVEEEVGDEGRDPIDRFEAGRDRRVDERHGAPALELVEDRVERLVAEVGAGAVGEQHHPVGSEGVEGPVELVEGAVDVGQGQRGEKPEPIRVVAHDLRGVVVDVSCDGPRVGAVPEEHTRGRHRQDGDVDVVTVH